MSPDDYKPTVLISRSNPLDAMLDEVEAGDILTITQAGEPIAVMISHDQYMGLLRQIARYQGNDR